MRRIQDGPVRGISFKLQEDERERKDQIEPEVSAIDRQKNEFLQIEIDQETKDMIRSMGVRTQCIISSSCLPSYPVFLLPQC